MATLRVALIHDWLLGMRGGERCLEVLCSMFPDADIYTLFYDPKGVSECINQRHVTASPLNRLPGVVRYYRGLLPLYPFAAKALGRSLARAHRESAYDLVVSVSHCAAKNVPTPAGVPHLCYCLTPVRYLWDQYQSYFAGRWYEPAVRLVAAPLRRWDVRSGSAVTRYVGISRYVSDRIKRYYGRTAGVVYPPVRTDWISPPEIPGEGFLCVSALVPYKNVDLIIRAFTDPRSVAAGRRLTVVGSGPEGSRLHELASGSGNIRFLERLSDPELAKLYRESAALVFAAEEDFGMVPVEMQAAGRPVICYRRGGALETVRGGEAPTGLFFDEMTVDSLCEALAAFDGRKPEFEVDNCLKNAQMFSLQRFVSAFDAELEQVGKQIGRPLVRVAQGLRDPVSPMRAVQSGVGNFLESN